MRRHGWLAAAVLTGALTVTACGQEGASSDAESPPGNDTGAEGGEDTGAQGGEDDPVEGAVPEPEGSGADVQAELHDPDGQTVGSVTLTSTGDGTEVRVEVRDLPPGFHGLHVHGEPECEADSTSPDGDTGDFLSAGGHLGVDEADHGEHAGDLPSLYVTQAGGGTLVAETDGFTVDDLQAAGGAALIVHSDRDNFAHIPERYAPDGPDQDTLDTGDAGDRIACAVLAE